MRVRQLPARQNFCVFTCREIPFALALRPTRTQSTIASMPYSPRRSTLNSSKFFLLIRELEDGQATFLPRLWRRKENRETRFLREIKGTGGASLLFSFERAPMSISCPCCQGEQIHRSRTRGILQRFLTIIFIRPYRCEDCDLRFFRCSISDKPRPVRVGRTS